MNVETLAFSKDFRWKTSFVESLFVQSTDIKPRFLRYKLFLRHKVQILILTLLENIGKGFLLLKN